MFYQRRADESVEVCLVVIAFAKTEADKAVICKKSSDASNVLCMKLKNKRFVDMRT